MKDLEQARSLLAMAGEVDRQDCINGVGRLLQHVQRILTQAGH